MQLDENIVYRINHQKFSKAHLQAMNYATLSLPWTVNRMHYTSGSEGLKSRLSKIILGKITEYLLWDFFKIHGLKVLHGALETKYWEKDKSDFLIKINDQQEEWDIKSLMFDFSRIKKYDWLKLPALIPDHHKSDQWSKKHKLYINNSFCKRYLFVYLNNPGLRLHITDEQAMAYSDIIENSTYYKHQADYILRKIGNIKTECVKNDHAIIISAYAGRDEFVLFKKIAPGTLFCGNLIKTRIKNRGIEVGKLPSFNKLIVNNT